MLEKLSFLFDNSEKKASYQSNWPDITGQVSSCTEMITKQFDPLSKSPSELPCPGPPMHTDSQEQGEERM